MSRIVNLSRRQFFKATAAGTLSSGLLLGCTSNKKNSDFLSIQSNPELEISSWLHISKNNRITITIPSVEMGQGAYTGMAQLVADELDADWSQIQVKPAPFSEKFENPKNRSQMTNGSNSIRAFWTPMREVGATAKSMLLSAAALHWGISEDKLVCKKGYVFLDDHSISYGELAGKAAKLKPPEKVELKSTAQRTLIGRSKKRLDAVAKVKGEAEFGIDVIRPGMLIATVAQSPVFGGELQSMNESDTLASPGVKKIVPIPNGVAVVADTYWHALKGLKQLKPRFIHSDEKTKNFSTETAFQKLTQALDEEGKTKLVGYQKLDLEYKVPLLSHATMEPMNCTAHVQNDRVDIWVPTQSQTLTAKAAAKVAGMNIEQVYVHATFLGGGFGRRGSTDFVIQAVTISKAMGVPIKVIWSREEDIQHDYYRPIAMSRFQIALDDTGQITEWHNQMAAPSIFKQLKNFILPSFLLWLPVTKVIGDPIISSGVRELPYSIENQEFDLSIVDIPIPVWFWRSVGHSHNSFFKESAIDEAAILAQQDPFFFRQKLLQNSPKNLKVLETAAALGFWGKTVPGRFQGIAVEFSYGSYVAVVVEISMASEKEFRIHKVSYAVDCGQAVNPDLIEAQVQGGMVFGLTAAVMGEITIKKGRVQQSNFHDYPMLKLSQMPEVVLEIIESSEDPGGIGEVAVPPIAPALTNALFAATQVRIRELPIQKSGFKLKSLRS